MEENEERPEIIGGQKRTSWAEDGKRGISEKQRTEEGRTGEEQRKEKGREREERMALFDITVNSNKLFLFVSPT